MANPDFTITIQGVGPLIQRLGRAAAMQRLIAPAIRAQARLVNRLAKYPPPPPNSKYVRTGDLGRAWTAPMPRVTAGGLEATVANAVRSRKTGRRYGPFVQGELTQASIHRGRWTTDAAALELERSAIERDFKDAIDDALS